MVFCVAYTVGGSQAGVRYITEELIRKIAKEDNFDMIASLNLTLAKEGGKKIKVPVDCHSVCSLCVCVCVCVCACFCVCVC